jgi:hypothetical protein
MVQTAPPGMRDALLSASSEQNSTVLCCALQSGMRKTLLSARAEQNSTALCYALQSGMRDALLSASARQNSAPPVGHAKRARCLHGCREACDRHTNLQYAQLYIAEICLPVTFAEIFWKILVLQSLEIGLSKP